MTPVEFMVFDLDNDITAGRREAERPPCSASGFEGRPVEPPVRNCDAALPREKKQGGAVSGYEKNGRSTDKSGVRVEKTPV